MDTESFIIALLTGATALVGAIAALITGIKARNAAAIAQGTARHANTTITDHIVKTHDQFPIQPPTETDKPLP